ncbi:RDD family protein [Streptosporangium sp. 'caverna']|uniref:RDD family protein n=1 Tax=Streptosporangium sp. 'caverna' TaxID=2202249 RepID=UPI000D7E239B|nr:RDD family protein [Streptosporangium sp. 'caverna']AWS42082.1 hypothetical protein DKM19_12650 [Streptosporangium sp. 'caverna']
MTAEPPYQNQYGQNPYEAAPPPLPELAFWWERLLARLIDGIILGVVVRIIITPIITGLFPAASFLGLLVSAILGFVIYGAYEYFQITRDGQTLGKKLLKIRITTVGAGVQGGLDSETALKRTAVLWGPQLLTFNALLTFIGGIFSLVNVLSQFWDKPLRQCLHDKVANTVVVRMPH